MGPIEQVSTLARLLEQRVKSTGSPKTAPDAYLS